VGIPQFKPVRRIVHRTKEFEQFVEEYDGRGDVFVAVYDEKGLVDKLMFDFDGSFAFEFARQFANYLYIHHLSYIPIITGKKGYHIYVLLYPEYLKGEEVEQKNKISMAQNWLIEQSGCYYPVYQKEYELNDKIAGYYQDKKSIDYNLYYLITDEPVHQAKFMHDKIYAYVRLYEAPEEPYIIIKDKKIKWWYTPACDTKIIGDIRRLTRVPNTKRVFETGGINYCTYLPIRFFEKSEERVLQYQKAQQPPTTPEGSLKSIDEIALPIKTEFRNAIIVNLETEGELVGYEYDSPLLELVEQIMNPGIFRALLSPEPPNMVRVAAVCEMKHYGMRKNEILQALKDFGWSDWDESVAEDKVDQIFRIGYKKFSKSYLIREGLATERDFEEKRKRSELR
jgi:hypothetical protein